MATSCLALNPENKCSWYFKQKLYYRICIRDCRGASLACVACSPKKVLKNFAHMGVTWAKQYESKREYEANR